MRRVKLTFDCLYCGRQMTSRVLETEQPDAELQKTIVREAICENPQCPEKGHQQEAMYPRVEAA